MPVRGQGRKEPATVSPFPRHLKRHVPSRLLTPFFIPLISSSTSTCKSFAFMEDGTAATLDSQSSQPASRHLRPIPIQITPAPRTRNLNPEIGGHFDRIQVGSPTGHQDVELGTYLQPSFSDLGSPRSASPSSSHFEPRIVSGMFSELSRPGVHRIKTETCFLQHPSAIHPKVCQYIRIRSYA
jgi:hypothetical protein